MWTVVFWKDAVERAVKTAAQSLLALIAAFNVAGDGTDWTASLIGMGIAVGLSFLTSILSSLSGSPTNASAVK